MGNKGGMFMAQMLQINTTLESLDVGDTDLVSIIVVNVIIIIIAVNMMTTIIIIVITVVIIISYNCMIISRIKVALKTGHDLFVLKRNETPQTLQPAGDHSNPLFK